MTNCRSAILTKQFIHGSFESSAEDLAAAGFVPRSANLFRSFINISLSRAVAWNLDAVIFRLGRVGNYA
jgi:hypothetical protein